MWLRKWQRLHRVQKSKASNGFMSSLININFINLLLHIYICTCLHIGKSTKVSDPRIYDITCFSFPGYEYVVDLYPPKNLVATLIHGLHRH